MSTGGVSIWQLIILVLIFCIFILPCLMALFSKKANGLDKVVWFFISLLFGWLGYFLYYYLVIKKKLGIA
jgi:hypothetical protein